MEGAPKRPVETKENIASHDESPESPKDFNAPVVIESQQEVEDKKKEIDRVKERLLSEGYMTIEPIEGDPFTRSRDHIPTGEGVTIYHTDGTVEKMSFAEDAAIRAKELEAVRYFSKGSNNKETTGVELFPRIKKFFGFLKKLFSSIFSSRENTR